MSVSSSDGFNATGDLAAKYQKLASEYAKIRSQLSVLKQAIRDEQTMTLSLKEEVKMKNQELRKNNQEIESLSFRNQQLTKRITVLQEELEKPVGKNHKSQMRPESNFSAEESKLFQEELQNKILQNASLLSQLEEKSLLLEVNKMQSNETITRLEDELRAAKSCESPLRQCKCAEKSTAALSSNRSMSSVSFLRCVSEVVAAINEVLAACGSTSAELSQLTKALPSSQRSDLRVILIDVLTESTRVIERSDPNSQIHSIIRDFVREIINFLDSGANEVHSSETTGIVEVLHSLRVLTISVLESPCPTMAEKTWRKLRDHCDSFQREVTDLEGGLNNKPIKKSRSKEIEKQYLTKIQELEKRISELSNLASRQNSQLGGNHATVDSAIIDELTVQGREVSVDFIKQLLLKKSSSVLEDLQNAESKFTAAQTECDELRCRLENSIEENEEKSKQVVQLEEILAVTTRNYEDQIGSLSEHMANMNDKLTAQETTIEELQGVIVEKENKRRK